VAAAVILLTLPLVITFNAFLTSAASFLGFDRIVTSIVPYEAGAVADLLKGFGLAAGNNANSVWLAGGFVPVVAFIDWNCAGWQGFVLFGLTAAVGLPDVTLNRRKAAVIALGVLGVFAVNVLRIFIVVLLGYYVGYPAALVFHDYGGTLMILAWLLAFWTFVLRRYPNGEF
jgi:exosortase/archaeosortase family protein